MAKPSTTGVIATAFGVALVVSGILVMHGQRIDKPALSSAGTILESAGKPIEPTSPLENSATKPDAKPVIPTAVKKSLPDTTTPAPRTREELARRAAEQREKNQLNDLFSSARLVAAETDGTYPVSSPSIAHRIVLPRNTKQQEITLRIEYPGMQSSEQAPLVRVAGTSGRFNAKSMAIENALLVYLPADKTQLGGYIIDINFLDRAREGQHRYLLNLAADKTSPH